MKFKLSEKSGAGTSLQEYFACSYKDIVKRFGKPNNEGDDYKVSTEWVFESDAGDTFTVYDYKETNLYDSELPSVTQFRNLPKYDWHIGARDKISAQLFKAWFQVEISKLGNVHEYCEYCKKSPSGRCGTHTDYFSLAKEITKPQNDGVHELFKSFKQDLKFAIMHGKLSEVETRIDDVLRRYEGFVRELCGDVRSL